jgi:flagellar basal body-associated protein FliL
MAAEEDMNLEQAEDMEESEANEVIEESGQRGRIVLILLIVAGAIVLFGGLILISYWVSLATQQANQPVVGNVYEAQEFGAEKPRTVEFNLTEKEPLRIMLDPGQGVTKPVVVQAKIGLKFSKDHEEEIKEALSDHRFEIVEKIETTVAQKSPDELNTSDGLQNLKIELAQEVNNILGEQMVMGVIVTGFDVIEGQ